MKQDEGVQTVDPVSVEASQAGGLASAGFTAGPWAVVDAVMGERVISRATYDTICAVDTSCNSAWTIESTAVNVANARLIAAAPDLLEAARELDAMWTEDVPGGPDNAPSIFMPETLAVWRKFRAAIAKATGDA